MYQCGQLVVYGSHGVCRILDMEIKTIDRKKVEYYVLEPADQSGSRYYVPCANAAAVAKLCPLLSRQELDDLIRIANINKDAWISDENQRKQRYRELINSGDRLALIQMIHALLQHKAHQQELGRKFHLCDENFLRDAQKLLSSEFSVVLGIPQDQVGQYIQSVIYE